MHVIVFKKEMYKGLSAKRSKLLKKEQSVQVECGFNLWPSELIKCFMGSKGWWSHGEVIWSHKEAQCANLLVSLMTSWVWFGSCPNPKGGNGELTCVFTSSHGNSGAELLRSQTPASLQDEEIPTLQICCSLQPLQPVVLDCITLFTFRL